MTLRTNVSLTRALAALGLAACLMAGTAGSALAADAGASGVEAAPAAESAKPLTVSPAATEQEIAASKFADAVPVNQEPVNLDQLKAEQSGEAAPTEMDPKANPRVYEIAKQLRCLVCANETIAESNTELAIDLRKEVAAQVTAGKTDDEIIACMVERYGDFVLFKPPFKAKTYFLWLGPIVFFALAFWAMVMVARSRRAAAKARLSAATPETLERAKAVLRGELVFVEGEFVPAKDVKAAAVKSN